MLYIYLENFLCILSISCTTCSWLIVIHTLEMHILWILKNDWHHECSLFIAIVIINQNIFRYQCRYSKILRQRTYLISRYRANVEDIMTFTNLEGTKGLLQRLPPSSTFSWNLIHLLTSRHCGGRVTHCAGAARSNASPGRPPPPAARSAARRAGRPGLGSPWRTAGSLKRVGRELSWSW